LKLSVNGVFGSDNTDNKKKESNKNTWKKIQLFLSVFIMVISTILKGFIQNKALGVFLC